MKIILLRNICLLMLVSGCWSMQQACAQSDSTRPKNIVGLHLTQLLVREVQVSYERYLSPHYSLEGMVGIRIPNDDANSATIGGMFDPSINQSMPFFSFAKSYYAAAGIRYYFRGRRFFQPYVTANLFFRNNYYDNKIIDQLGDFYNAYTVRQTQNQQIWGLKMLFGFRTVNLKVGNVVLALDTFVGLGVRNKAIESMIFEYERGRINHVYPEPEIKNENTIAPSVQFGVKLDVCWD
ncbi:MAG: hypothetical protein V4714_04435 [Bacteroidota bacterium]